MQPFHLAFPVTDLEKTHDFYHNLLGCPIGRTGRVFFDDRPLNFLRDLWN